MAVTFLEKLGYGGFGDVWKARDTLDRLVAVKIIRFAGEAASSARAHAQALARINHANVVTVHTLEKVIDPETQQEKDGVVMELIEGTTLADRFQGNQFSLTEVRSIGSQLVDGLAYMHSQGLAHGDFHKYNVMLGHHGVKIIDILYYNSLAELTTVAREEKLRRDINALRHILEGIFRHSEVPPEKLPEFGERLFQTDDLRDMGSLILEYTGQDAAGAGTTSVPPSIRDLALATRVFEPTTLQKYNEVLGIGVTTEELAPQIPIAIDAARRVQLLPIPTRELLALIVGRLKRRERGNGSWEYEHHVLHPEIVGASGLTDRRVVEHVSIMERHGIAVVDREDRVDIIRLREMDWWFIWGDIREFCDKTGIALGEFLVKLRFDLFD